MGTARRAGGFAVALAVAAMAVAGCGGGAGGGTAAPRQSGGHADAAAREHREPDGAQRSGAPSPSPSSAPGKEDPAKPEQRAPRMTAVSHVLTGGARGFAEVTVDSAGRWKRTGEQPGKLTASQMATLNRLLGSSSLAQEAKRYAAANPQKLPSDCGQPLAQTLRTSKVTLRKSTCDKNFVATPTYDQVVKLLWDYTNV